MSKRKEKKNTRSTFSKRIPPVLPARCKSKPTCKFYSIVITFVDRHICISALYSTYEIYLVQFVNPVPLESTVTPQYIQKLLTRS